MVRDFNFLTKGFESFIKDAIIIDASGLIFAV
jgi:hypothetical protein